MGDSKKRNDGIRQLSSVFTRIIVEDLDKKYNSQIAEPIKKVLKNNKSQSCTSAQMKDEVIVIDDESAPNVVPPIVISKPSRIHSTKSFVKHPLSLGVDYNAVRAAYYRKNELKKAKRAKKNMEAHSPLSKYIRKKPIFPNFVDPVPENHKFEYPQPLEPRLTQIDEISSSNREVSPDHNGNEVHNIGQDGFVGKLNKDQKFMLIVFFGNLCPAVVSQQRCNSTVCDLTHVAPDNHFLEQQLLRNTLRDAENVYEFVQKFPSELRNRYFSVFARIFVDRKNLKQLVRDSQKIVPFNGFGPIINGMVTNGWLKCDAVKFLIANHVDTPEARISITELIGTTGSDVIKFIAYLKKIEF